jgi:hypothetical protein
VAGPKPGKRGVFGEPLGGSRQTSSSHEGFGDVGKIVEMRHLTRMSKKPTTISGPVLRDFGPLPAYGVGFSWALAKNGRLTKVKSGIDSIPRWSSSATHRKVN